MAPALLIALLPYLPNLLEFLVARLHTQAASPAPEAQTNDQLVLATVREMVEAVGAAHPEWPDDEKRRTATGAIRAHLEKSGVMLTDSQVNVLVELFAARAAAQRNDTT